MNTKKKKVKDGKITYSIKNIGFSISIPDNWLEVKKTSYDDLNINPNTLFVFVVDKFTTMTAVFGGFCKKRGFNKFFDKFSCDENFKILNKTEKEFSKVVAKQVIVENDGKKIMNSFCLINGMVVNFIINIDPNKKLVENKRLLSCRNVKVMNEVLDSIKIFDAINPPIYVSGYNEDDEKEKQQNISNVTLAKSYVEQECRYKNILLPDFYLKCVNGNKTFSCINNEIYFSDASSNYRFIKVSEEIFNDIQNYTEEYLSKLNNSLSCDNIPSDNMLVIKKEDNYVLIDLEKDINCHSVISELFNDIFSDIKKITNVDLFKYNILSTKDVKKNTIKPINIDNKEVKEQKEIAEKKKKEKENKEFQSFLIQYDEKKKKEKENREFQLFLSQYDKKMHDEQENKAFQSFLKQYDEKKKKEKENLEFREFLLEYEKKLSKEKENEEFRKFLVNYDNKIKEEKEQAKSKENLGLEDVQKRREMEQILNKNIYESKKENESFDSSNIEFTEYFHNVDGFASFKLLFPEDSGEKVIRDFNVFDIVKDDELEYRIFIFKCDSLDKYEEKLNDWMDKNIISSNSSIIDTYTDITENSLEIKTYILDNGKFYKASYNYGYLIAISGYNNQEHLLFANMALDSVEIGEDSREYIESYDRKMNSINILRSQGIPYIDELPVIESSYEVNGKTMDDIAKRAIVLCVCCNFASDIVSNAKKRYLKESKKFFNKLLDKLNVKDCLTIDEKKLFDKMDKNIAIQISWQFEGYAVLLWTLGLIDDLPYPDVLVSPDEATAFVSACDTYKDFISKCNLRDVNEVLDLTDLTYRYNWYCVEARINNEEPIINPEVVVERYRALKWMLSPDAKWDNVDLDS